MADVIVRWRHVHRIKRPRMVAWAWIFFGLLQPACSSRSPAADALPPAEGPWSAVLPRPRPSARPSAPVLPPPPQVLAAPPAEAVGGAFCGAGAELLGFRCCPRARSSCAAASPPFPLSSRWVYWGATVAAASPVPVAAEELLLLLIEGGVADLRRYCRCPPVPVGCCGSCSRCSR